MIQDSRFKIQDSIQLFYIHKIRLAKLSCDSSSVSPVQSTDRRELAEGKSMPA